MMRALYVSQTGMTEPLGRSQVIPYLKGLTQAGWRIDLLAFEPATATIADVAAVRHELADWNIAYTSTRRSPSHSLGIKLAESGGAFLRLFTRALALRPRIVHARSYLPGAVAHLVATMSPRSRFLFDCRGLLGDEYADFGHWSRHSFNYRLLKVVERRLFAKADGIVVLTDRLRRWLIDEARFVEPERPVEVIPCCIDLEQFRFAESDRAQSRAALAAGDRLVVAYSGSLGAWYCEPQMAELFAMVRRQRPALLAVFTRASAHRLKSELRARGIDDRDVVVQSATQVEMPRWLSGADLAISFAEPRFSKIASSPVKVSEYLALGLPVVVNRGVGDQDELMRRYPSSLIDAGLMASSELAEAAQRVVGLAPLDDAVRERNRKIAIETFALDSVGISRYRALYERLAE